MKRIMEIMGMPVSIEVLDMEDKGMLEETLSIFTNIDKRFSTYKKDSEISRINRGEIPLTEASEEMKEILELAEETRNETHGFFDIRKSDGTIDPSGVVKGWAILKAADHLRHLGSNNFMVEAGGDVEVMGVGHDGNGWNIGIRNPRKPSELVKIVRLTQGGVATSGEYFRGEHIYNPKNSHGVIASKISSITVIGPDILEADRFATAAFAMGQDGINFVEETNGIEGFMIDNDGMGTRTTGFHLFENA
jgi:thiamine biosynthesis lipoprotein